MIGFDSIGRGAIGESASDLDDVLLFVPAAAVAVAPGSPPVIIGTTINAPAAAAVATTDAEPIIAAGKLVSPPAVPASVATTAPGISISFNLRPPGQVVAIVANPPSILGGNYIEASNTITMITPYGEIGSASIGEFAIGEGEPSTRIVRRGPLVVVTSASPLISAGKSINAPSALVTATSARAEIASRRRRLRILAIAS
jgi:hypothetical protein